MHKPFAYAVRAVIFIFIRSVQAQITVACAANLQYAMEEIKTAVIKTGAEIKPIYGASGKFVMQIKNGAPFDVFVSADMDYPRTLYKEGLASGAPIVYAVDRDFGPFFLKFCFMIQTTSLSSLEHHLSILFLPSSGNATTATLQQ